MPDHGLGRKPNVPDDRDWSPAKLHSKLGVAHPPSAPSILDMTIRQAVSEGNPFVTTWKGILALWKLIKAILFPPSPTPTPPPPPIPPSTDGPLWERGPVLDQGSYGTCVGNAWAGWGNAAPVEDSYLEADARKIYFEATCIGGSCDPSYQNGSSTRDGVKAMQARGKVTAYAFANTVADVSEWLQNHGPVVIGIDWTNDMFNPDSDGTVHDTGSIAGGHEIVLIQDVPSKGKLRARNSWGASWGKGGDFYLTYADFSKLLAAGGDACLASEI
jgi:hypothetical protein